MTGDPVYMVKAQSIDSKSLRSWIQANHLDLLDLPDKDDISSTDTELSYAAEAEAIVMIQITVLHLPCIVLCVFVTDNMIIDNLEDVKYELLKK